jgi:3-oxoacyl-[acyl-carrier-protein] synthase II
LGVAAFWESLAAGRSGIRRIQNFDPSGLPTQFAGEIQNFDAKEYIDRKERKSLKMMARPIQLAVAGAAVALKDGGIETSRLDPTRFGVVFGAGLIASELDELAPAARVSTDGRPGWVDLPKWGEHGLANMPPLWMLKYLPNMLACHVSILHDAQGPNNSITASDAAPILAMGEAYRVILRGQADVMLTGGADSRINPLSMTRMSLFLPLSRRNEAPEKACRPFDRRRDGIVPGEGAGIFVLENLAHARKRGARIYAEVIGFGAAFDPKQSGEGLARAITLALNQAGIHPEQIDHVNAQGYSTLKEDAWEARGIAKVFGAIRSPVPVFAPRSYFGSMTAAGGAVELTASLLALQKGLLPPTLNYEEPDPACPVPVLTGKPREVQREHVLKISFTEMGQCAAVVLRNWGESNGDRDF